MAIEQPSLREMKWSNGLRRLIFLRRDTVPGSKPFYVYYFIYFDEAAYMVEEEVAVAGGDRVRGLEQLVPVNLLTCNNQNIHFNIFNYLQIIMGKSDRSHFLIFGIRFKKIHYKILVQYLTNYDR